MTPQIKENQEVSSMVLCVVGLSFTMVGLFVIADKCNVSVILGTIVGSAASILNYYLQILTLKYALNYERDKAVLIISFSKIFRMLLMSAIVLIILLVPVLHDVTGIIAMFFPQISRAVIHILKK